MRPRNGSKGRVQGSTFRGILWRPQALEASVAPTHPVGEAAHFRSDMFGIAQECVPMPGIA